MNHVDSRKLGTFLHHKFNLQCKNKQMTKSHSVFAEYNIMGVIRTHSGTYLPGV